MGSEFSPQERGRRPAQPLGWCALATFLSISAAAGPLLAAPCTVPGTHVDLHCAIRDLVCTDITLGVGSFPVGRLAIDRDLTIHGAGPLATTLVGRIAATGATADVTLADFRLDATSLPSGCETPGLASSGGARIASGSGLQVLTAIVAGECPIFEDGFESGSACSWTSTTP